MPKKRHSIFRNDSLPDWEEAKKMGNELFAQKNYDASLVKYSTAIELFERPFDNNNNEVLTKDKEQKAELAKLYCNRAAANYQLASEKGKFKSEVDQLLKLCLQDSTKAIKLDEKYYKPHFRYCSILYLMSNKQL